MRVANVLDPKQTADKLHCKAFNVHEDVSERFPGQMKTNNEVDGQHLACHEPMRFGGGKRPVGLQENMDDDDTEP